ncbi:MAG TPA: FecR domain-containing protein [Pyrinomonadaceae bacterium]|nr:FecR domain-containing protein [Pyrinomonadaceae bacterium]
MATTGANHFEFDWWVIQKRAVYVGVLILLAALVCGGAALYVWKFGNPLRSVVAKSDPLAGARFMSFEGDVRVIRAATRQIIYAGNEIQLYPGDTVQTQADGRARISMADGSTVVVRPNSTIIIRDNESADNGKRSNVHVVVDSGQMLVHTSEQTENNKNVIETPKTQNQIAGQTNVSFGVAPEGTEEIRVSSGNVQSINRLGERVALQGGEYVSVNQSGTISKVQRLLDVPQPSQPRGLEKIGATANGSANVSLRWQKPQSGAPSYYRVEVATSPFFVQEGKVIERDQLSVTEFNATDLRPGTYFWRVRATAASGQTSDWSEPEKFFVIASGGNGSTIAVSNLKALHLGGDVYLIRGTTLPGANIRVSGRETPALADGTFQVQITAPANVREVNVQASDSQGNTSNYRVTLTRTS